jgi:hypothetical protein
VLDLDAICDLTCEFSPCEFHIKLAESDWEIAQARKLRRAVFCIEQGVFVGDDIDEPNESRTCKQKMRMSCEELQRAAK